MCSLFSGWFEGLRVQGFEGASRRPPPQPSTESQNHDQTIGARENRFDFQSTVRGIKKRLLTVVVALLKNDSHDKNRNALDAKFDPKVRF